MRSMTCLMAVLAVTIIGCSSGSNKPTLGGDLAQDARGRDGAGLEVSQADGDAFAPADGVLVDSSLPTDLPALPDGPVCVPDCAGKECGADGCGGACGECLGAGHTCNEAGLCQAHACESSKDCPGDLICDKGQGICVACVLDADCGENQKCEADQTCVDIVPCVSDKDCKALDMVCDKEAGECVECLTVDDCPVQWMCIDKVCFEPACAPEEVRCNGKDIEVCSDNRTGWDLVKSCPESQFCVGGKCLDQLCVPDSAYCEGTVAYLCNGAGSETQLVKDCADDGLVCLDGECTQCVAKCEGSQCGDDGCGGSCGTCPDGLPCVEHDGGHVCGTACDLAALNKESAGCEFWAVDLDNVEGGQFEPVALFVAVPPGNGSAKLAVERFDSGAPIALTAADLKADTLTIAQGSVATLTMPEGMDIDGSQKGSNGLRIRSSVPISMHQFNPLNGQGVYTSDASMLMPVHLADKEYRGLSWGHREDGYKLRGNLAVVATESGTTLLQVWPSAAVNPGGSVGAMTANPSDPYEFALVQGEVLAMETQGPAGADLTGSRVVSNKRVVLFGGHECANIPLGTNFCDHIEEQLTPVANWGKLYAGDAFVKRGPNQKDVWRVVASQNDTQVAVVPPGNGPWTLQAGEWQEFLTGESFLLEATKPVLVGHYLTGSNHPGFVADPACNGGTGIGDPAFSLAVPVNRFKTHHRVLTPAGYDKDYLNIVVPLSPPTDVAIDLVTIGAAPSPIGQSGYGVYQVPVNAGVHEVTSSNGAVGVTVYGYACDVSYAYPGGM
jgi:hypothetical protein